MEMKELIEKFAEGCKELIGHDPEYKDGVYECRGFSLDTKSRKLEFSIEDDSVLIVKKGDKFKIKAFTAEYGYLDISLDTDLINDVKVGEHTRDDKRYKVFVFETDIGTIKEAFGDVDIVIDLKD